MENHKPFINIPLTMTVSLIVANVLFMVLYPENWPVGLLGAVFFILCLVKAARKKLPAPTFVDSSGKQ